MPAILFKLRNVPDDEAAEIRELLSSNNIEFYETPAGRWGISMEAIWLKDEALLDEAKSLIDNYQAERYKKVRQEYEELKQQGEIETFSQRIVKRPLQSLFYLVFVLVILYFATMPFIKLTANG